MKNSDFLSKPRIFKAQIETETKTLADIQERKTKLNEILASCEDKVREADLLVEKGDILLSMGWDYESLDKVIKLTKEAGSPEEILSRLELLKPSAEAKAELESTKTEVDGLRENYQRQIKTTTKNLSTLINEQIPAALARMSNLANQYNTLAEKYNILQADFSKLDEKYQKLQKSLDDAISFTILLEEPEKLPGDRLGHIFFGIMFPRLEAWCKNKMDNEKIDIISELAKRTIGLYAEPVANFMRAPEKRGEFEAVLAIVSFAVTATPFREAFTRWYTLHKHEKGVYNFWKIQYHLEEFYKELRFVLKSK